MAHIIAYFGERVHLLIFQDQLTCRSTLLRKPFSSFSTPCECPSSRTSSTGGASMRRRTKWPVHNSCQPYLPGWIAILYFFSPQVLLSIFVSKCSLLNTQSSFGSVVLDGIMGRQKNRSWTSLYDRSYHPMYNMCPYETLRTGRTA